MSDQERLEAIRQRAEAATPGPWVRYADDDDVIGFTIANIYPNGWPIVYDAVVPHAHRGTEEVQDNFDFIAHAREDVPWLLQQVEELTRQLYLEQNRNIGLLEGCSDLGRKNVELSDELGVAVKRIEELTASVRQASIDASDADDAFQEVEQERDQYASIVRDLAKSIDCDGTVVDGVFEHSPECPLLRAREMFPGDEQ